MTESAAGAQPAADAMVRSAAVPEAEAATRNKRGSKIWWTLGRIGVSAAVLAWLGWKTDWGKVADAFQNLRVSLWLAAVGMYVAAQVVSGYRWKLLSEPLGFRRSWLDFTSFYFVGMFFNMFLPTSVGGDVVRALFLDPRKGHRLKSFLSVLVDRASGLLVLLLVACVAMAARPITLPKWVFYVVWGTAATGVAGVLGLLALSRWGPHGGRLRRLTEASQVYFRYPGIIASTTALSLVIQAANVVLVWLIGLAMGIPVPGFYYWIMAPMVTVLTLIPLSFNGMGLREWGCEAFLGALGVDPSIAHCLGFLWFLALVAAGLAGGAVYLFGWYPEPEGDADDGPVRGDPDQGRAGQPAAPRRPPPLRPSEPAPRL